MTAVIAFSTVFVAGFFLYDLLQRIMPTPASLFSGLPTLFGLGSAALYIFFLWASWVGPVHLIALYLWVILLGGFWFALRRGTLQGVSCSGQLLPGKRREQTFLGIVSLLVICNGVLSLSLPILDWDTRILWALKAQILTAEPTLTGEAFRDPYRLHIHPRYPLMVPFLSSWIARHQGEFLEAQYQLLISTFATLAVWQFFLLLMRLSGRNTAYIMSAVMALSGVWMNAQFIAGVEIVLTFFLLLAVSYLFMWQEQRHTPDLLLAGTFLFCAAMTKNEGLLLALCATLALCVVVTIEKGIRPAIRPTALLAGVVFLLSAAWFIHLVNIPPVSDEQYLNRLTPDVISRGLQRLPSIAEAIFARMCDLRQWHLLWLAPFCCLGTLLHRKSDLDMRMVLLFFLAVFYCAGLLTVYLISPWRDIAMQINVTFDRVALPLVPLFLLMLSLAFPGWQAKTLP